MKLYTYVIIVHKKLLWD